MITGAVVVALALGSTVIMFAALDDYLGGRNTRGNVKTWAGVLMYAAAVAIHWGGGQ